MRPFHNILSFVAVSNFFYYPSPSLFHLCKHVRKLTRCFSLSILHLICPMSVNFSKTSFLIMSDRKFICFFLILSLLHFFLVFLNISSLFIYSMKFPTSFSRISCLLSQFPSLSLQHSLLYRLNDITS